MAIFLKENAGLYEVFGEQQQIGTIKAYRNDFHKTNCYLQLNLVEYRAGIAAELFEKLQAMIKAPLQIMLSSEDKEQIAFLEKGGFHCKRKCFEMEVTADDMLEPVAFYEENVDTAGEICICEKGTPQYDACGELLYSYYSKTHEAINPLTATYDEFVKILPKKAVYRCDSNGQMMHVAFIEENELAYVATNKLAGFRVFVAGVIGKMFEKYESIFFECDDCDTAAMELRALFQSDLEESYNTYIRELSDFSPIGIMILGSSGAGKTTLGRLVAEELGFTFIDIDDYIWRKDTAQPFTKMYSKEEKIERVMGAAQKTEHFVMAGSMNSFHEHFDPFFKLAVHLHADAKLRVKRVHEREMALFGERVLAGGDMYEEHQKFLTDVAGYDAGVGSATLQAHQEWLDVLSCKVIRLDGADALEENVKRIVAAYEEALL